MDIDLAATLVTDAACNGDASGSIDLTVTGGTAPYTYAWSNGATTEDISGLTAGTYTVIVTDDQGCTDTETFTIDEPSTLDIDLAATVVTDAACNGDASGSIDLTITGGTAPYTYAWSNGATTEDISGITGGTCRVIVTDAQGGTETETINSAEPTTLENDQAATVVTDAAFTGDATG